MKGITFNCIICNKEAIRQHHSQVTCGKLECRKEVKKRWKQKNLDYQKECMSCGVSFTTRVSSKRYCSKECSNKIRKLRTSTNAAHWARKKNGTYDKYAMILRGVGYTVLSPVGGVK